jgi:hypothetical protein
MADQPLALRAVSTVRGHIPVITLAAFVAMLSVGTLVQAKQQCSATQGSRGYWSWRLIDGRKCWYEGKPMLSKSLLEWTARRATRSDPGKALAGVPTAKLHDPMDAQAQVPDDAGTFEALWRDRIRSDLTN